VAVLILAGIAAACQNPQRRVREAMSALAAVPQGDEQRLDAAHLEALARAHLVEDDRLRQSLLGEIEQLYQQRKEPFEAARRQAAERLRRQQEIEHARELALLEQQRRQEQERARAAATAQAAQGVKSLRWQTRASLLDDGTRVLVLHNRQGRSADFHLTCHTRAGASKTLFVSVPAYGQKEIGFLEGWPGNFVSGEWCEAFHGGEKQWRIDIP
jgi:hypothetical protein